MDADAEELSGDAVACCDLREGRHNRCMDDGAEGRSDVMEMLKESYEMAKLMSERELPESGTRVPALCG